LITYYHFFIQWVAVLIFKRLSTFIQQGTLLDNRVALQGQKAVRRVGAHPQINGHTIGILRHSVAAHEAVVILLDFVIIRFHGKGSCRIGLHIGGNGSGKNISDLYRQSFDVHMYIQALLHVPQRSPGDHCLMGSSSHQFGEMAGNFRNLDAVYGAAVNIHHKIDDALNVGPPHLGVVVPHRHIIIIQ